jgi:uncharacterized protein YigA (DUF484 family)
MERRITDYMESHPDFFERHPDLLHALELPHQSGAAVSLIERQVKSLREENIRCKQQLSELVDVARENETLNQRLHDLVLALIETVTFDEVVNALEDRLHEDFQADAVELRLFSAAEADRESHPNLDGFRRFLDHGKPKCGQLPKQQLSYLFGPQSDDIRSTALIPIDGQGLLGLLAIGSLSADRFHPGMGTEYLTRLGEIVSKTLEVVSEPGF